MEPVRPVYDGPGAASVVPALLGNRAADWLPEPTRDASTVVVLVVDGLGWDAVDERREELLELAALEGGPITTVAPSTTASALTSITTGLPPSQHGVVGFRVLVDGAVLNVLSWQSSSRHAPDPFALQRHPPFLGRPVPVVTKAEFAGTGFTEAHLRGARLLGWKAVSSLVERCRLLAADREPLVYAYYDGVDAVAHAHGLHDGFYAAELRAADRLVGDLRDALPESAALLVVSDHGQVHVGPEGWLDLGDGVAALVDRCSGDGRFRHLHARRGEARALAAAAADAHTSHAWVFSKDQLLDEGWLGPAPSPPTRRRVGDVVLAARDLVAFVDPALPREARLISAHGSLTPAEMLIPCLAARGRA